MDALGAGSIINGVAGLGQLAAGIGIKKGKRPTYQIPGAAREALSISRQQAGATTRPGNDYAVDQINKNQGSGFSFLKRGVNSGSQLIAGAIGLNANTNQAISQNNAQNSAYMFNAKQNLQNTLNNFSQYQEKSFYENQMKPYMDRVNTKAALIGSGIQNVAGAANDYANQQQQSKYMDYLTSGGQQGFMMPNDNAWRLKGLA